MEKQDESKTLKERLEDFQSDLTEYKESSKEKLLEALSNELFPKLAKSFLYGGYISVGVQNDNREVEELYRIYIDTVEFYFHCEEGSYYKIEDPIVYHQNRKAPEPEKRFPYFPLMTLHAHASGYDITFENGEEKYRASALIRKYEVHVVNTGEIISEERSTYLYAYLNGFPLLGETHITWKDDAENSEFAIERKKRKNVYRYKMDEDGIYIFDKGKYVLESEKRSVDYLDNREWSFSKKVDKKP